MNNVNINLDTYLEIADRAHRSYMEGRVQPRGFMHPVDLASESASFFEAFIHVVEAMTSVNRETEDRKDKKNG